MVMQENRAYEAKIVVTVEIRANWDYIQANWDYIQVEIRAAAVEVRARANNVDYVRFPFRDSVWFQFQYAEYVVQEFPYESFFCAEPTNYDDVFVFLYPFFVFLRPTDSYMQSY